MRYGACIRAGVRKYDLRTCMYIRTSISLIHVTKYERQRFPDGMIIDQALFCSPTRDAQRDAIVFREAPGVHPSGM